MSWNIRGINKAGRTSNIRNPIKNYDVGMCFLLETKMLVSLAGRWPKRLGFYSSFVINEIDGKSHIMLLWNPNICIVDIINVHDQAITAEVSRPSTGVSFIITGVYGRNSTAEREVLWDYLQNIKLSIVRSWLMLGDFNAILDWLNELGGRNAISPDSESFAKMLVDCALVDLGSSRGWFSWSNSSSRSRCIRE
ncbi:uncharacterized protein LOC105421598 [Amborella trichopoda]|uniref:uncharacterized protein LOC105421598 n=1 Tax=Amborella trichopoda TaxID=13333 RepID=UPI0005D32C9E|nr:uncharacterized protein LOC105421598 [Amborella trichopoda]|eukprot:XP_011627894.1 uncharacterized protein LOC105421598 [Amborella trichopoda]